MGGPSGHGQKNKPHKAGRSAGLSARQRARQGKEGAPQRVHPKASGQAGKAERRAHAKQLRDAKRQELLEKKRRVSAPVVVAVLPLSADVHVPRFWHGLCGAFAQQQHGDGAAGSSVSVLASDEMEMELGLVPEGPLQPRTLAVAGRGRVRVTLLPPPASRSDLLAVADLARCAEVLLLLLPGGEGAAAVDNEGSATLAVLRAIGLPSVACCVVGAGTAANGAALNMKERSAGRKRAEKALATHLAGDHRLLHADTRADLAALARHVAEHPPAAPLWRQQRPTLMAERIEFLPDTTAAGDDGGGAGPSTSAPAPPTSSGTLVLYGYVRGGGLTANQLMTVPGAGDFRIKAIYGPPDPNVGPSKGGGDMETEGGGAMLLVQRDPEEADTLVRENVPDPLAGEQTWPTEEEMDQARALSGQAAEGRRRKLPKGTSEYQAAWILDAEDYGDEDEDDEDDGDDEELDDQDMGGGAAGAGPSGGGGGMLDDGAPDLQPIPDDDAGTEAGDAMMGIDDYEDAEAYAAALEEARRAKGGRGGRRGAEEEASQLDFPDEVDVPLDTPARVRFQKYRGLKSLRSSPWDPKEELPPDYARVFAFENFKRAHKRAREAQQRANNDVDPCAVPQGSWVAVHLEAVPEAAAARVASQVAASAVGAAVPLTAFGLLQHEAKMSVVNFALRKVPSYPSPIASKEEVVLMTGLRTFRCRPILSSDDPGRDKHKMERFLHAGHQVVASVYAPIMYPPLPVLAFKVVAAAGGDGATPSPLPGPHGNSGSSAVLAAVGSMRSCDPDRIVLKRIMLTGAPVRVHKRRATVRFMFHNPEDVRWFRPVEVATKNGRRGRITDSLGTHGAMKCLFDQPPQQHDTVCMPLYKRVYPKWPADLTFADR